MNDTYIFPCVFTYKESGGIGIYFPDLDGCTSYGDDEQTAYRNAREALSLHLYAMEKDGDNIPEPSGVKDITVTDNKRAVLVEVFMPAFRAKQNNKFVKKTLTIPQWLNIEAERAGVNFSQVLQSTLKEHLGIA
ncbi:MAG: type II toxin-antitoxin system HicB family antitoxin [Defluviitaleaceae bacterium]|nr:type II toxin-antitoxin system HicB family antitoxin [Defluviitaleaceae bacterium]MCL2239093.1 type II toxin-antitoxin system HicB family antitoxin [Defluviitaleaceae bacterium]